MLLTLTVNGQPWQGEVAPRLTLADLLRDRLHLTGTHLGCEHGVCGACTVEVDGQPIRACLMPAVAAEGCAVTTVEGLTTPADEALRAAFTAEHGVQCGYCTPGMLMTARDILRRGLATDEATIRQELAGNICRCTGYQGIVAAIRAAAQGAAP